jgi:hypothetical protein
MGIHNVWHSTSIQPLYLCRNSSWVDVSNRGWNCQLAVSVTQPIPHSLAVVVDRLLGNDAASRRIGGPDNSIRFLSLDKRRVAPISACLTASPSKSRACHAGPSKMPAGASALPRRALFQPS